MMRLYTFLFFFLFCMAGAGLAQQCNTIGQTPSSAFPVCGVDTFVQTKVPICSGNTIPVPGCESDGVSYTDKNPYWYKFTCFTSGTLGFLITPNDMGDDYDWELFDITGRNPNDVYTDKTLVVIGNWAGTYGLTGASSAGVASMQCASDPLAKANAFSLKPSIIQGHTYLLMVSHYTDSQIGYRLSFGGGTASITDPLDPNFSLATTSCDGTQIRLKLNKKIKCSSLAGNGTDFTIAGSSVTVTSATGFGCSSGFDMDSVTLLLSQPLAPGSYNLLAAKGSDSTTLLDNCNQAIPVGTSIPFIVFGRQPTPFDSLVPVKCAPTQLQLQFKKNINCNSIAPNGSDFSISGPYPVSIASASGNCTNGVTSIININLVSAVVRQGTYTITLNQGTDGTTIVDECGEETVAGATLSFTVKDTVNADISYTLKEACEFDTIYYSNPIANGITSWSWTFDNTLTRSINDPVIVYSTFGAKTASLVVSNGFCADTALANIYLNKDSLIANFSGPSVYCPNDLAIFRDTSIGDIFLWNWEFGNGNTSSFQFPPPQVYPSADKDRLFPVRLIVTSNKACTDTLLKFIKVVNNCYIAVPTAFTPNKDGRNDYLYPLNAYKATNLQFSVFNKWGQRLFTTKDWTRKWDGTFNGNEQATGTYVWFLQYTDTDTGKTIFQKGTTVLIR